MKNKCFDCMSGGTQEASDKVLCALDGKARDGHKRRACGPFKPTAEAQAPKRHLVRIDGQPRWVNAEVHAALLKTAAARHKERYCSDQDRIITRQDCEACKGRPIPDGEACKHRLGAKPDPARTAAITEAVQGAPNAE
jgi:hypothetical protein